MQTNQGRTWMLFSRVPSLLQFSVYLSRPPVILRIVFLIACTATVHCRPETLLVYEIKPPEKVEGWQLYRYDRGMSLRAEAEFDTIKLSVVVAGPRALGDLAQRISEKRERGRLDVQPIRIMISKAAEPDAALNFSDFVIVHNGNMISQIDYATYIKVYSAPGLLDYEWTFGQRYLSQFQLEEPDWLRERQDDTASPLEKRQRLEKRLASYKPWAPPVLRAGEVQVGWILFPQLEVNQDYRLEYRPGNSQTGRRLTIPALPFRVQMDRRQAEAFPMDSDDDKDAAKLFRADREAINRANEEFMIMHKQLLKHDPILPRKAPKT